MKSVNFLALFIIVVQSLGLISCSQDKKAADPAPAPPFKVADRIQIKDLSGKLRDQNESGEPLESMEHQIVLTEDGKDLQERTDVGLQISTVCSANGSILKHSFKTGLRGEYWLMELLPSDLIGKLPSAEVIWSCDLNFEAEDSKRNKHIFSINNVAVKPTESGVYSFLQKDGLRVESPRPARPLIVKESELPRYNVVSETSEVDSMVMWCSRFEIPLPHRNTDIQSLGQMNIDAAVLARAAEENQAEFCRIKIFRNSKWVGVSPLFHLIFDQQLKGGEIEVIADDSQTYTPIVKPGIVQISPVWQVKIHNPTSGTRYYKLNWDGEFKASPLHVSGTRRGTWLTMNRRIELTNRIQGADVLVFGDQTWWLQMPAGSSIEMKISAVHSHICSRFDGQDYEYGIMYRHAPLQLESHQLYQGDLNTTVLLETKTTESFGRFKYAGATGGYGVRPGFDLSKIDSLPESEGCRR